MKMLARRIAESMCILLLGMASFGSAQTVPDVRSQNNDDGSGGSQTVQSDAQLLSAFQFGVNAHRVIDRTLDCVREMHMGWVRVDGNWRMIEPTFAEPPQYDWRLADEMVRQIRSRGIRILWDLGYTPTWASSNGELNGVPKDDVARRHWRLFVRACVERYAHPPDDIDYFSPWNEPNLKEFWTGSLEEYINYILIPASEEIRAVGPQKMVVAPDLAFLKSSHISIEDFFKGLKNTHASQYIDIVSQHVYQDEPGDIIDAFTEDGCSFYFLTCWWGKRPSLFSLYKDAGLAGKPVWLTEFGWRSDEVGEIRQANYLLETLLMLASRQEFKNAFIYELGDSPVHKEKDGMLRADGTHKEIYKRLVSLFQGMLYAVREDDRVDFESSNIIFNQPRRRPIRR